MSKCLRALETVAKDRHVKSLQHYDDIAVDNDDIVLDEQQQQASTKLRKSISDNSRDVLNLAEGLWKQFLNDPPANAAPIEGEVSNLLATLQAAKKAAKDLGHIDDEVDALIRGGTPQREVVQRRHHALSRVADSLWRIFGVLCSIERLFVESRTPARAASHEMNLGASTNDEADEGDDGETLAEIASATGFSIAALRSANPSLKNVHADDVVPAGTTIRLPSTGSATAPENVKDAGAAAAVAAAAAFQQRPASTSEQDDSGGDEEGESLEDIARKTGVPLSTLQELNPAIAARFSAREKIPAGTPVRIPEAAATAIGESLSSRSSQAGSAQKGHPQGSGSRASRHSTSTSQTQSYSATENLRDVANATGVTVDELRLANPEVAHVADDTPLPPNTKLVIPSFTSSDDDGDEEQSHTRGLPSSTAPPSGKQNAAPPSVRSGASTSNRSSEDRGDTLEEVATLYGTTVAALVKHNPELAGIHPKDFLPVGLSIQIPTSGEAPLENADADEQRGHASSKQQAVSGRDDEGYATEEGSSGEEEDVTDNERNGNADQRGQTIASLSSTLGVTEEEIRSWNPFLQHIPSDQALTAGWPIRIPKQAKGSSTTEDSDGRPSHSAHEQETSPVASQGSSGRPLPVHRAVHKQRPVPQGRGDSVAEGEIGTSPDAPPQTATRPTTLSTVALEFGITIHEIRRLNPHLRSLGDDQQIPPLTSMQLPQRPPKQEQTHDSAKLAAPPANTPSSTATASDCSSHQNLPEAARAQRVHQVSQVSSDDDEREQESREQERNVPERELNLLSGDEDPLPDMEPPVATPRASLATIAHTMRVSVEELREFNPRLRQYPEHLPLPKSANIVVPPRRSNNTGVSTQHSIQDDADAKDVDARPPQETLASVSSRYHIPISVIREHNPSVAGLGKDVPIPASTALKLPLTPTTAKSHQPHQPMGRQHAVHEQTEPSPQPPQTSSGGRQSLLAGTIEHQCSAKRGGDSLQSIAHRYQITVSALRHTNPAFSSCDAMTPLPPGIILQVPQVTAAATSRGGSSARRGASQASEPSSTIADEDELREATPRDTLYSDASRMDERILFGHEENMTSPNHSARLCASERVNSGGRQGDDSARYYSSGDANDEGAKNTDDDDAYLLHRSDEGVSAPRVPYVEHDESTSAITTDGALHATVQNSMNAPTPPRSAQEKDAARVSLDDADNSMGGVAMIKAGGETLQQLSRRLNVQEPELRAVNPQLQSYHHKKALPVDMLVTVPSAPARAPATSAGVEMLSKANPNVTFVSKNAPKTWESDGMTTVAQVCTKHFVREDVLRDWNPFLRRYHSKTVVPPGATIYLEPRDANRISDDDGAAANDEGLPSSPDSLDRGLPIYVKVGEVDCVSLKTIALRYRLHEGGVRKLNPHMVQYPFDALLPAGSAVCVRAPTQTRWETRIPHERLSSVQVLESKCHGLIRQRYFLNWKAIVLSSLGGKKHVQEAELKDERDELSQQVAIGKMCEADLRRRVTELRMVVDSMRNGSPSRVRSASNIGGGGGASPSSRTISPNRNTPPASYDAFVAKSVDRAASLVSPLNSGTSPTRTRQSRGRETSPIRRAPVVADVGGLGWVVQPERLSSISPARARSGNRNASPSAPQLRLAQAVANEFSGEHRAESRPVSSPRRGQKPSLGLMLSGLRVAGVTGSAEHAGIKVNDAILRVDGKLVSNAVSFRDAVARAPGPRVCITVQHPEGGATGFMLPLYPSSSGPSISTTSRSNSAMQRRTTSPTRRVI